MTGTPWSCAHNSPVADTIAEGSEGTEAGGRKGGREGRLSGILSSPGKKWSELTRAVAMGDHEGN